MCQYHTMLNSIGWLKMLQRHEWPPISKPLPRADFLHARRHNHVLIRKATPPTRDMSTDLFSSLVLALYLNSRNAGRRLRAMSVDFSGIAWEVLSMALLGPGLSCIFSRFDHRFLALICYDISLLKVCSLTFDCFPRSERERWSGVTQPTPPLVILPVHQLLLPRLLESETHVRSVTLIHAFVGSFHSSSPEKKAIIFVHLFHHIVFLINPSVAFDIPRHTCVSFGRTKISGCFQFA